ncbi:MAG: hypothetical protein M5U13_10815 [Thermoanaerobaculia bacterium]|nr:hypothetical protein [Thermoanaerobaculia bacterium]
MEVVPGEVTVALRQAQLYGGETSGTLRFDYAQEGTPTGIDLALARVDLDRLLASRGIELGAPVDGRLSGELSLRLALADLATLEGAIGLAASPAGREGAVAVAGPLVFSVAGGKLRAEQLVLAGDGFALTAEGGYDVAKGEGSFDYRVEAESLVPLLDLLPVAREPEPLWLPTSGQGTVEGRLDLGRTVASELRLDLARPRAPGLVADRLAGTLAVGESGISWLELDAWQGVDARLRLSGRVPFAESEPLSIAVSTTAWPFAAFAPWLPVELPVDGPATAEVVLSGPLAALSGSASAELRPASAAGLAAESLAARLAFSAERLELDQVALRLPAGEVTARGVLEFGSEALAIDFEAPALHLGAEPLAAVGGVARREPGAPRPSGRHPRPARSRGDADRRGALPGRGAARDAARAHSRARLAGGAAGGFGSAARPGRSLRRRPARPRRRRPRPAARRARPRGRRRGARRRADAAAGGLPRGAPRGHRRARGGRAAPGAPHRRALGAPRGRPRARAARAGRRGDRRPRRRDPLALPRRARERQRAVRLR